MKPNKLLSIVNRINNSAFPEYLRQKALTLAFNSNIKYAGTTGISIQKWGLTATNTTDTTSKSSAEKASNGSNDQNKKVVVAESIVYLKNRFHVQNHIGGIHATAMATLAESATGMVFGLFVPDKTHVPLIKSMNIQFTKRAIGNLKAHAILTKDQKEKITNTDRGATIVQVKVTDQNNNEPIQCQMEWAWTTKPAKK